MIEIGLLGYGTVGQAVVEILQKRKDTIQQIIGQEFKLKKILVRNLNKYSDQEYFHLITDDIHSIVQDPHINVLIEVTGAVDPIYQPIKEAFIAGKHFITANKAFVSKYLEDIINWQKQTTGQFRCEAAVGGALPIMVNHTAIATLNQVTAIQGVLNGTSNIILTLMEEGATYDEALAKAQEIGFAEADPSDDVQGIDSMRKLRILASLLFKKSLLEKQIQCQGITEIKPSDIEQAKAQNARIKLLASAHYQNDQIFATVKPSLVDSNSLIGQLEGGENAVIISTDNAGDIIIKGQGGGGRPTAFAVLSDLLAIFQ